MDEGDSEPAEVLAEVAAPSKRRTIRRARSVEVEESVLALVEVALEQSREPLAAFFDLELVSREGPGFLCYSQRGFYRPHRDRARSNAWPDAAHRLLTIILFINDDFKGGELRLLPDEADSVVVHPAAGTLVAFDAATLHEVLPVIEGRRYTVVDWWL